MVCSLDLEFSSARFMLAQKIAKPWAFMTSYGRIGGIHCSENRNLLQGILRDEWNFDGIVISDWCAIFRTPKSILVYVLYEVILISPS